MPSRPKRHRSPSKRGAAPSPTSIMSIFEGRSRTRWPGKAYRRDRANELHPTDRGFKAVADRFDRELQSLP